MLVRISAGREYYMTASKPIVSIEEPPANSGKRPQVVRWNEVASLAQAQPDTWLRLTHDYRTSGSARSSVQRAAKLYGLEYRVTTSSPQDDGRIGVFIRYNTPREEQHG